MPSDLPDGWSEEYGIYTKGDVDIYIEDDGEHVEVCLADHHRRVFVPVKILEALLKERHRAK